MPITKAMSRNTQYRICHLTDDRRYYMIFDGDFQPLMWARGPADATNYSRADAEKAATVLRKYLDERNAGGRVLIVPAHGGMAVGR
jgi:hypothetical protein